MKTKNAIVIGAGLGGMSAAISLAADGHKVTLLEKNKHLGGKLNLHSQEGYTFDMGPSIFTLPQYFDSLFSRAGKRREDYFEIQAVKPHWRNFFEDGSIIDLFKETVLVRTELSKISPHAFGEYEKFMAYARKNYELISKGYFEKGLDTEWEMLKFYGPIKMMFQMDSAHTMDHSVRKYFTDPRLVDIFNFFIKYVGSSALRAPGFFNLMPTIQVDYDLWYVKGGLFEISRGFEKLLRELGVHIRTQTETAEIICHDEQVTGVRLNNGENLEADIVISNMEVLPTYRKLLKVDEAKLQKWEKKFEPTCSGLVLHLGTDKVFPELAHHNFFFSKNQSKHFDSVFADKKIPEDPTLYVVAPTRTDPSKAPKGGDNIKVLPHIPHLYEGHSFTQDDYDQLKERIIDKLERTALKDLRKHIVTEHVWTPFDIEKNYYSNRGSIYGVVSDRSKNFGFKFPKTSALFKGLYFVGGSVNPGGGMPMVVLSGQKVADRIEEHIQKGKI